MGNVGDEPLTVIVACGSADKPLPFASEKSSKRNKVHANCPQSGEAGSGKSSDAVS
jgi:hypothetical protein